MTPEQTELSRRLFTAHPELADGWTPGRMCPADSYLIPEAAAITYCPKHRIRGDHEIPPPDLLDWEVFGRLLLWLTSVDYWPQLDGHMDIGEGDDDRIIWKVRIGLAPWQKADDPRIALALAIDAMEK